jgi:hypothetical protein
MRSINFQLLLTFKPQFWRMFDGNEYPKSIEESQFEQWLEEGRESKMAYEYMLIVWDELDGEYHPEYVDSREKIRKYPFWGETGGHSATIAVYDLFSESRITVLD